MENWFKATLVIVLDFFSFSPSKFLKCVAFNAIQIFLIFFLKKFACFFLLLNRQEFLVEKWQFKEQTMRI